MTDTPSRPAPQQEQAASAVQLADIDACPHCKRYIGHRVTAVRHAVWVDLLAAFTQAQREHIARLLAHKWHIGGLTLRNTNEGRDYTEVVTGEAK